jgi:hypothetical protein
VAKQLSSLRSIFVRSIYNLPTSTNHELAVVLFDLPPIEKTLVERRSGFLASAARHSFPFVRDALALDRQHLIGKPYSWHHGLVCLLRNVLGAVSTVSFNPDSELAKARSVFCDEDYNFFYIQECTESESLSFYRLFEEPDVLYSFRAFLESLDFNHRQLIILFSASLLRFRFCLTPREWCPLCGKKWLWEHFFTCARLDPFPDISSRSAVWVEVRSHISLGHWDIFLHYLRFCLLEWHDLLSQVAFPRDVIDGLC